MLQIELGLLHGIVALPLLLPMAPPTERDEVVKVMRLGVAVRDDMMDSDSFGLAADSTGEPVSLQCEFAPLPPLAVVWCCLASAPKVAVGALEARATQFPTALLAARYALLAPAMLERCSADGANGSDAPRCAPARGAVTLRRAVLVSWAQGIERSIEHSSAGCAFDIRAGLRLRALHPLESLIPDFYNAGPPRLDVAGPAVPIRGRRPSVDEFAAAWAGNVLASSLGCHADSIRHSWQCSKYAAMAARRIETWKRPKEDVTVEAAGQRTLFDA